MLPRYLCEPVWQGRTNASTLHTPIENGEEVDVAVVGGGLRLYPALSGVPIERRWFGRVAMTSDHLPHVHEPEQGLLAALGCQGRGVGLMAALGERIAAYLVSGEPSSIPFLLTSIRPIPLHRFRQIGVAAAIAWYRMLDALEQ